MGQTFWIATKHQKEAVIEPVLAKELNVTCKKISGFDTDAFGTFCGTVARTKTPLETARLKANEGARCVNARYVISSEGSFGPHPLYPMIACDVELLLLLDRAEGHEWHVTRSSVNTNFGSQQVENENQLVAFARLAQFPGHGLMLRTKSEINNTIVKGISTWAQLKLTYRRLKSTGENIFVETDMRAMFNPTRMRLIGHAARDLASLLLRACPACSFPGFGVTDMIPGLACRQCGLATRSVKSHIYTCQSCGFLQEDKFPYGKQNEEPLYCFFCNP
ncbi:MAG: hypothetical protein HRU69_03400 [Flammeovirgaceae bacterium]|nr:MAG: hypothetical protein HRU69_03400 [Flammeovirgaceae bacterium]